MCSAEKWGIIGRNTLGGPNAVYRVGPYGRSSTNNPSANVPPPYGIGSLGIIVGNGTDRIAFGNETDFAELPISDLTTLKYWVFTGANSLTGVTPPTINIEVDPNVGSVNDTTLVYLPDSSVSPSAPAPRLPNTWQQYDASAAGSKWYASGATGSLINCSATSPCSFDEIKARMPEAVITYSLGFSKGSDNAFIGAVDGLQVNNTVYDFEPLGVCKTTPTV
ncbi:hypothetical protein [Streptosporangium saharense]|uniref:hypothetical protein n=1 Tax=Streptosporangium saharense TaxID=1706840 RepID=UPI00332A15E4